MKQKWEYLTFDAIMSPAKSERCGTRNDLPVLSITMHDGIVLQSNRFKKVIASVDTSSYKIVWNGQLVIAFPIDEGLIYTQDVADLGIMSPAYNVWNVDYSKINRQFLVKYFHCPQSMKYYKSKLRGTTQRRRMLPKEDLLSMPIPVPPLDVQNRIVEELDLLTGIIDKQKAELQELDTLAQSIFYDMFENNASRIEKWKEMPLGTICTVVNGLVDPMEEPYCNYPHIGGANIESNTGRFINVKIARNENLISGKYLFDETMILYSKIRPNLNKVALPNFKGICSADMYPIIPDVKFVVKEFLKFTITQKRFIDYAIANSGRANIPKINRDTLMSYTMSLPPFALQQSFADKVSAIEKQKAAIIQSMAETQKLLDYTMDKYFG